MKSLLKIGGGIVYSDGELLKNTGIRLGGAQVMTMWM